MQQTERLRSLTESHLIAKDHIAAKVPVEPQPVEAVELVRAERAPAREGGRF